MSRQRTTTLERCPIGLFVSESGYLCLKTECGNNEGRIDAYIVSSGEFFWGQPPQTIKSQRAQRVVPIRVAVMGELHEVIERNIGRLVHG